MQNEQNSKIKQLRKSELLTVRSIEESAFAPLICTIIPEFTESGLLEEALAPFVGSVALA